MINRGQITQEFCAFPNLKTYLTYVSNKDFQNKIIDKDILERPIIFKWIKKSTTKEYLLVIDRKWVNYYVSNKKEKLKIGFWVTISNLTQ